MADEIEFTHGPYRLEHAEIARMLNVMGVHGWNGERPSEWLERSLKARDTFDGHRGPSSGARSVTEEMVTCYDCSGRGELFGLLNVGGRCQPGSTPCPTCKGIKLAPKRNDAWMRLGERCTAEMVRRGKSMVMVARALAVSVLDVGDMERGRRDPAPLAALLGLE